MKKRFFTFLLWLLISKNLFSQAGFVFTGSSSPLFSYSSGQLFDNLNRNNALLLHEGLQQSYLFYNNDTLLIFKDQLPFKYQEDKYIINEGDTLFYLFSKGGIERLMNVTLFSVKCPEQISLIAPYNTESLLVSLSFPVITPSGNAQLLISNNAHSFYLVGDTTSILWTISIANRQLVCEQSVAISFPPCGEALQVIDANGYLYHTIRVGHLCWLKENLKSTWYDDEDRTPIPVALIYTSRLYPDTLYNLHTFGRLYSWYSAMKLPEGNQYTAPQVDSLGHIQGVCPTGWRIPTNEEFLYLGEYAGGEALRTSSYWLTQGNNATDFSALPGGYFHAPYYDNLMGDAYFLMYHNKDPTTPWVAHLSYACSEMTFLAVEKIDALSMRCIKQ